LARSLRDLRISVTDRCNFRCRYCMPREAFGPGFKFLDRPLILSFEEITRLAHCFSELGVKKLRLTGGEPLLRRQLHVLVEKLSQFDCDLSLTTNGSLLNKQAQTLRTAGLRRLTVSVDSLDPETFERLTDAGFALSAVLEGIEAAERAGFESIKINMVVRRGLNEHELVPITKHFTERGHIVRFIEFMDVGQTNGWQERDVFSATNIEDELGRAFSLEPVAPNYAGEVARRFRIRETGAEVGIIASVSQPFCASCTRARLSAEGKLYTCLFAGAGTDLRGPLRAGASFEELSELIAHTWQRREDRYSELRATQKPLRRIEMSYIGG
jgi:cyclic pyranopterin phosphate synthase